MVQVIAKFGFGFISDKLRDNATKLLQDGGLTDEKFKGYIIRELNEINSKLDGISRRELSAGISWLKKGVLRLLTVDPIGARSTKTRPARTTRTSVAVDDAIAFANAIRRLKIRSSDLFEKSRECFKQAGIEATRAFHNTALSTEERILANKVRMASGILGSLDHPEVAASDCLLFLTELHAMPAIQNIFSVHINGGISSFFRKGSRLEAIKAVTMMNLNLSDFITRFTGRRMAVFDWPMVRCGTLLVHPIHYNKECFDKMKQMKITPPWDFDLLQKMLKRITDPRGAVLHPRESTLCCVHYAYGDDIKRALLVVREPVNDLRDLRLSPVDRLPSAHYITVNEDDYVYVLNVRVSFSLTLTVQIYNGYGSCLKHVSLDLSLRNHLHLLNAKYSRWTKASFYIGEDEDRNLIFCLTNTGNHKIANLYDYNGNVLSFPSVLQSSDKCTLVSEQKTVSIPNEHFSKSRIQNLDREIAFVYTRRNQFKGVVDLGQDFALCSQPLWYRYRPVIHVTAGGRILRCLGSRE